MSPSWELIPIESGPTFQSTQDDEMKMSVK